MTSPKKEKIIKIECLGEVDDYVYDLEVEDSHTFLANGIFVHNTDSIYAKTDLNLKELDILFYNFLEEWIKDYNSNCKYEMMDLNTKQMRVHNHAKIFEHEKTLDACIVVAKKRYYYMVKKDDK